jgi:hypothetical protein
MIVHMPWRPDRIIQPTSGIPELVGDALQVGRRIENRNGVGMKHTEDRSFLSPGIKICQSLSFGIRASDQVTRPLSMILIIHLISAGVHLS